MSGPTREMNEAMDSLAELNRERKELERVTPWEHPEPLKAWEVLGLFCMVLNGPTSINGYVKVPEGHPFYGVAYGDCPQGCGEDWCGHSPGSVIDVHGGITFSHLGDGGWWFGFDTSHSGDASPYWSGGRVWRVDDVAAETEHMAEQIAKALPESPAIPQADGDPRELSVGGGA